MRQITNLENNDAYVNLVKNMGSDIANCIISMFITDNNITTKNRIILVCIKNVKECDVEYVRNVIKCDRCELIHVQRIFECLIEYQIRQRYGVVYTPDIITEYITRKTIKKDTKTVCDPACGTGVFLLSALKRIHKLTRRPVSDIIENSIYGADILKEHVTCTKIILILYMLSVGEDKRNLDFNLVHCNSLTFDWKQKISNGFDAIIGNPPYIRIQDIPENEKADLEAKWKTCVGSYNIYFTFFELGVELLSDAGILGYVSANSFLTSFAGKNLRKWLHENRYVQQILDFTHLVLFDAASYTCVAFLDKKKKTGIKYGYVTKYSELKDLHVVSFDVNHYSQLRYDKWILLKTDERKIIEKIESVGQPLGMISDIHSGIATLKDKVFFLPYTDDKYIEKIHDGKIYNIESAITRNIIKISDLGNNPGKARPTNKIIFPYKKVNGKYELLNESELKKTYPECYKYLRANKTILLQRDKGKNNKVWYSYGRIQAFEIDGKKLLTPTFSKKPKFHFDMAGNSFFCNGYAICNASMSLKILQKILNSSIMMYYITKTSVFVEYGYGCFQKNFIERFGIPNLSNAEIKHIESINDPDQLDELLAKKYDIDVLTNP